MNKVTLDEYQRWVRSVEMNSSDYGSMLYYEESFVEGIQTTNGISALQWLYIDKRMPIE